jgi:hypothetical protein
MMMSFKRDCGGGMRESY